MDDIIVEKDYRRKPEDICEGSPEIDILNQPINGASLKNTQRRWMRFRR